MNFTVRGSPLLSSVVRGDIPVVHGGMAVGRFARRCNGWPSGSEPCGDCGRRLARDLSGCAYYTQERGAGSHGRRDPASFSRPAGPSMTEIGVTADSCGLFCIRLRGASAGVVSPRGSTTRPRRTSPYPTTPPARSCSTSAGPCPAQPSVVPAHLPATACQDQPRAHRYVRLADCYIGIGRAMSACAAKLSRSLNFLIFPDGVSGKASTKTQCDGVL